MKDETKAMFNKYIKGLTLSINNSNEFEIVIPE